MYLTHYISDVMPHGLLGHSLVWSLHHVSQKSTFLDHTILKLDVPVTNLCHGVDYAKVMGSIPWECMSLYNTYLKMSLGCHKCICKVYQEALCIIQNWLYVTFLSEILRIWTVTAKTMQKITFLAKKKDYTRYIYTC